MNFKKTLLMPSTSFEMRGNLTSKDSKFIKKAIENNLFEKVNAKNNGLFILHDGPPYANGNIHAGHALNKILKDIFIRHNALNGLKVEWKFGWDTHGLPIENALQKLGKVTKETEKADALKLFRNYALKQQQNQLKQFQKLALFTNYEEKYLTLENNYIAKELEVFYQMYDKNLIYRDLKPVYWSWSSQTALAEAEIEYKDITSNSIFVEFKISDNLIALIWTTTPWTLLANVGIAFGKKITYSLYRFNNKTYLLADELVSSVEKAKGIKFTFIESFNVESIIGQDAINPLTLEKSKIVYGHHVTVESGTGIVHIAGGHGEDDFLITKEFDLPLKVALKEDGTIKVEGKYFGKFYQDIEKEIISDLETEGTLFHFQEFEHSYPHDWRTKKPLVFLATKQWFVSLKTINDDLINSAQNTEWEPSWGKARITKMLQDRKEWCISRQRSWGVPIPMVFDEQGNPFDDKRIRQTVLKNIKEFGIVWWHNISVEELLEEAGIKGKTNYRKETDILDVWFDSGSSNYVLYGDKKIDLILEGGDQYRGWFNSSLIIGTITRHESPFKKVFSHGFVIDGNGQKMSKSLGNVVDPLEIVSKHGVDILRLWVVRSDYKDNLKISDEIIEQTINDYKKIRNTIRFILGNIGSDEKLLEKTKKAPLNEIDKIILSNLNQFYQNSLENYSKGNFNAIIKEFLYDVANGYIAFYLDYAKDILYTYESDNPQRLGIIRTLKEIINVFFYVLAPFIPITIEEAYSNIGKEESVFLENFSFEHLSIYNLLELGENFFQIKNKFTKIFENYRQEQDIKKTLEVVLEIKVPKNFLILSEELLKQALMVAKVTLIETDEVKDIMISISQDKKLKKCDRCWKFFSEEEFHQEKNVCQRCYEVINKLKE